MSVRGHKYHGFTCKVRLLVSLRWRGQIVRSAECDVVKWPFVLLLYRIGNPLIKHGKIQSPLWSNTTTYLYSLRRLLW